MYQFTYVASPHSLPQIAFDKLQPPPPPRHLVKSVYVLCMYFIAVNEVYTVNSRNPHEKIIPSSFFAEMNCL